MSFELHALVGVVNKNGCGLWHMYVKAEIKGKGWIGNAIQNVCTHVMHINIHRPVATYRAGTAMAGPHYGELELVNMQK